MLRCPSVGAAMPASPRSERSSCATSPNGARSAPRCASWSRAKRWWTWPGVGPGRAHRGDPTPWSTTTRRQGRPRSAGPAAGRRRADRARRSSVTVWPEFANGGKATVTLRQALCHQAGVPAIRRPLTDDDLWEWDVMAAALAETEAWWEPGTRHAYHPNTYGHLIGEVLRRVSGQRCPSAGRGGRIARSGRPLGVPEAERARCADVLFDKQGGSRHRASTSTRSRAIRKWRC